jgi:hypothetical protein
MHFFHGPMPIRVSVFAAWVAAWLCVACWIAKRVFASDGGGGIADGSRSVCVRRTHRKHVFGYFSPVRLKLNCPGPKAEEGAGGWKVIFHPPFPFFERG